ncbi:hypothetical protein QOZ80_5BG0447860 [Eleusine coracana subsp. coracana]|nr:hypothetical protein QOZ80_5BG0447860 [Eleusine coracana subsp. coracana]
MKVPEHTDVEIWDELELIAALQKFLFEKRYLIVIDDIWDASVWDIIQCALPKNKKEDYTINTNDLARQWVAEGFIPKSHGTDPEVVAKSYFNELINRIYRSEDMTGQNKKIRRLAVHLLDGPTDEDTTVESVQLRYLKIIANSHRVVLPSKIGSLQQLETFQLETNRSSSSSELSFCQLPADIVHVSRLLHLIAPKWIGLPDGIGKLKSLRTLRNFELGMSSRDSIKGLRELTNLTDLKIRCNFVSNSSSTPSDEVVEAGREVLQACLEKMCNLKYLHIDCDCAEMDVSISVPASSCQLQRFRAPGFLRVPKWIGQLHNLYDLKLIVKEVLEDDIEILAQLPSLTFLVLIFKGAPEHKIVIRESGFFVLKHLKIVCNKISVLTFEAGAMTKLEWLKLCFNAHGWDRHGAAPAGMEHLSGLKVIFVDIGGRHAKESNIRAARSALRNAIDMHPGRPAAKIKCHDDETFGFDEVDEEGAVRSGGGT